MGKGGRAAHRFKEMTEGKFVVIAADIYDMENLHEYGVVRATQNVFPTRKDAEDMAIKMNDGRTHHYVLTEPEALAIGA